QFGRLCQLSRKALRLYDERGLLPPARIDPESGYRYYDQDQVTVARRIRLLRTTGLSLDGVGEVLAAWQDDRPTAARLIQNQITRLEKQLETSQTFARLLLGELSADKERIMQFDIKSDTMPVQNVVSIRRHITVPAFHQAIEPTLKQLSGHIRESAAEPAGDPLALYYGPVNEEDDGPVEICVPFSGTVLPAGGIKVRQLPAHDAIMLRTFGEYNEYPKLLEMWDAVGRYVHDNQLESNWDHDMTTYEIWHEDMSMTICWPVRAVKQAA
ncbi:MAG: MerR family transcriptional regulator, partial [Chloroflexota bacterium]